MLTQSPLFVGLKYRFGGCQASAKDGDYRVFTTAFDETVNATDLPRILPKSTPRQGASFEEAVRRFESEFSGERITFGAAAAELVRNLHARLTEENRARSVVSFLIDHSGSMRGLRMLSAILAIETAVDALENVGIATEILGFTTRNWRGGRSRRAWRWAGKPPNPGRLCDIRYIIYGTAGRPSKMPWDLRQALRPGLLHENIDGEALEWAGSRLDPTRWDRRIICVISDGAPVDDSTLVANEDRTLLVRHLETVESSLRSTDITIGFLLLGQEHVREPDLHERAAEPEAAGLSLLKLIRRALIPPEFG